MRLFLVYFLIVFTQCTDLYPKNKLEQRLNSLKKQTVTIHNNIIKNNKELKAIKLDIDKNKQKQIIYLKYIQDKEILGKRLFFLLQQKLYISEFSRVLKSMQNPSYYTVSKQIVRGYFFNKVKVGINNFFQSFENLKNVNNNLEDKLISYNKKKNKLKKELKNLEKKITQVSLLQKKKLLSILMLKTEKKKLKKAQKI